MEVLLIGEDGEEVEADNIGEIAVKSRFLSPGYWRQPDLTRKKFKSSPKEGDECIFFTGDLGRMMPDGCLMHMGRKDFQVKIRGYRVEVAEIEMLLNRLDDIKEAVVVSHEDRSGDRSLVAYLVPAGQHVPPTGELRRFLAGKVPDYMIPSTFVTLETLPLLPNGKVDRHALPPPRREHPTTGAAFEPPRNATEEILAKIWAEVLELDQVGIHDNFYELGGQSLLATRIVLRIHETLQMELTLRSLFEAPTVAQLATVIEEMKRRNIGASISSILPVSREAYQRRQSESESN
jgi:acyl carrier protein